MMQKKVAPHELLMSKHYYKIAKAVMDFQGYFLKKPSVVHSQDHLTENFIYNYRVPK